MNIAEAFNNEDNILLKFQPRAIFLDYILVFMLIATSGIVFFYMNEEYIALSLIISLVVFINRGMINKIDNKFIFILLLFVVWELFQSFYFQSFSLKPVIGTTGRFLFAYMVIKCVNNKFSDIYVNIIYLLSIISLIFYIFYFFPQINNYLLSNAITKPLFPLENQNYGFTRNYILFSFDGFRDYRNAGPFWEAGAFSVFLCIAILFNTISTGKLLNRKNILFILTILTTISTAGYLTLFFIIASVFYLLKPAVNKLLVLLPMMIVFIVIIVNLPFLFPKIENNIIIAKNDNTSRFGSALSDFELISQNPVLGYGRSTEHKYKTSTWDIKKMHRNNGVMNFITQWGIILFLFYFINYTSSFKKMCIFFNRNIVFAAVLLISILLLGFSQTLFQYPFFHSLMFLQFAYNVHEIPK
jgi:hypothetical protein